MGARGTAQHWLRGGRRRVIVVWALIASVVTPGVLTAPNVASAFDQAGYGCGNKTNVRFKFSGWQWNEVKTWKGGTTATPRALAEAAIANWRAPLDGYGNPIINNQQGQEYELKWSDSIFGYPLNQSTDAVTACDLEEVIFNSSTFEDMVAELYVNGFVGVVAHELGHVYGQGHSGRADNFATVTGQYPVMSTCLGLGNGSNLQGKNNRDILVSDDYASAADLHSTTPWRAVTPNHSFEYTTNHHGQPTWWWSPGVVQQAGGAASTPKKGRVSPNWSVYTRARVWDSLLNWLPFPVPGLFGLWNSEVHKDDLYAAVSHKDIAAGIGGRIGVRTVYRLLWFPNGDSDACNFANDLRNGTASPTPWYYGPMKWCYPTTAWNPCQSDVVETANLTYLGEVADAADVQVQVYNETTNASGAFTSVDIDLAWVLYNFDL